MQAICAHPPILEPPLGQRLHFKAVMFPGMRSGEVLVISMRITGCLEREDCQVTAQDCLPSPLEHYGNYLHGQVPFQVGLSPSNLYGPPPAAPITPAPVAPVATTEFSLPEIIENRSVKIQGSGHGNFIPLSQHYLPPAVDERPNYESPKPRWVTNLKDT